MSQLISTPEPLFCLLAGARAISVEESFNPFKPMQGVIVSETLPLGMTDLVFYTEKNLERKREAMQKGKSTLTAKEELKHLLSSYQGHIQEEGKNSVLCVSVTPTDPYFPYLLESMEIKAAIPFEYPNKECFFSVMNKDIASVLKNKIESALADLSKKWCGEVHLIKILRWLDKNMEALLKHTGPDAIKEQTTKQQDAPSDENKIKNAVYLNLKEYTKPSLALYLDTQSKNISLLSALEAKAIVECKICRYHNTVTISYSAVIVRQNCVKCKRLIEVEFHPEHFYKEKTKAASLNIKNGFIVDLSKFSIQTTCGLCIPDENNELISSLIFAEMKQGVKRTAKCKNCYAELSLAINKAHFVDLLKKKQTKEKDKIKVVIGQPLPKEGTCKHYRKSYRWFRFRCCGRLFPCDVCHEEEVEGPNGDKHEMVMAVKVVCGFCSREQPVGTECVCGKGMVRKQKNAFWEGGKGVRNPALLSRNDTRKFKATQKKKN